MNLCVWSKKKQTESLQSLHGVFWHIEDADWAMIAGRYILTESLVDDFISNDTDVKEQEGRIQVCQGLSHAAVYFDDLWGVSSRLHAGQIMAYASKDFRVFPSL